MAKSKYKKIVRPTQSAKTTATPPVATVSSSGAALTSAGTLPRKQQVTHKGPPVVPYVSTELKTIGIITVVIIAAIIVLYFVLR
jgi:hypothetical protein